MTSQMQAKTSAQTKTLRSINPATLEVLGEVPNMSPGEVGETIASAWKAFDSWQHTTYEERGKLLLKLGKLIEEQKDEIATLISSEVGKPLAESYLGDISGTLDTCVWLAQKAQHYLKNQAISLSNPLLFSKRSFITFEPLGVIGVISPWNYPFSIPMMTMLMAVMAGDAVVLKPSGKSMLTGMKVGELFRQAGFPDGLVSVVTGDRATGEAFSRSRLSKLIFTGSVGGGAQVMDQASAQVTPVCLELGGKDPAIVLNDIPVDWTACGLVWGAFTNAGQACASIERLYLVRGSNNESLIEKIVEKTKALKVGPGADPTNEVGPLIDKNQYDKVAGQVEEAVAHGAKLLCGGARVEGLKGYFYKPTVLTNVDHSMQIMTEETFGPVLPIMVVESEEEAIKLANQSEFGLTASVWTSNVGRAKEIARRLTTGTVFINDGLFSHASPQLPWGGLKKSGFGRTHSQFGLMELVNIKHISEDSAGGMHRIWWYPYNKSRMTGVRGGLQFFHSGCLTKKGEGLRDFIANIFFKG
jgi:succinate-semialdehyde dehydrogenase/glutarate-semialdehyde dehydrogenase